MSIYNFKKIQVVPSGPDLLDIILSKIQRKTPTVVHPNFQISRIRSFYMRKVKFAQDCFDEKLNAILTEFPKLDEIHPFYADLMNVLYDRDHYKLALGQMNTARHLIDNVAKDYLRLLKFGDSLFRCKQLKRAALGRMATIMKRQKDSLAYLEQVRQHLARLPSIDPNTRTLLICGYPNVGKSSFMNKLTRAEVEVQPYAFTTKSLFVGHMDYRDLRWQVIDTPGILDHPLEQRNTIEMQSVTAMAHIRACVMFFLDLSEQCGYSIAEQVSLYDAIKPLFANKPTVLVINKIDVMKPENLPPKEKALVEGILKRDEIEMLQLSCWTEEGVMDVRNRACDILLQSRVESKLKGSKVSGVLNKLHLATPTPRDDRERPAFIPDEAKSRVKYDRNDPNRRKLARDIEAEQGGAGVYNVNLKDNYLLKDDDWKQDVIPEIMDGKNVADFIDPDIEAKLDALEREEERLIAEGFYESEPEELDSDEEVIREAADVIREKKKYILIEHREKKAQGKNRPQIPQHKLSTKTLDDLEEHLKETGIQADMDSIRSRSVVRKRARSESRPADEDQTVVAAKKRATSVVRDRSTMGIATVEQKAKADDIKKKSQRERNQLAKAGEADRHIGTKMPKHLFSGKRGMGSASHR
ncbi:P-loop containing nucleoside triphosphate hydrolase protein [Polychytrium aggregatum]|uniref:P-loop containing nucleoside triphosphate hydrolase protein n=1 Tax=Polychytrium aggregatum TaxID=110093 RepID=UPI0022FEE752|nr:P-loop containing nucleoside triphosphate hydrolase protein [Polychytrium aggregatum]KAI9199461.1 P-loop containing nucleoside triphosphate hydrolase protein [Polychytrium aggregatum]